MPTLKQLAWEVYKDWYNISPAARPYLAVMYQLTSIEDKFGADDGRSVVQNFLVCAQEWEGPVARRVKKELKAMIEGKSSITRTPENTFGLTPAPIRPSLVPGRVEIGWVEYLVPYSPVCCICGAKTDKSYTVEQLEIRRRYVGLVVCDACVPTKPESVTLMLEKLVK